MDPLYSMKNLHSHLIPINCFFGLVREYITKLSMFTTCSYVQL